MHQCFLIHLSGEVQGVGLRASIRNQARKHSLVGWVKNNPDGTVSALIQGEENGVEQFLWWLRTGEYASFISGVETTEQPFKPDLDSFSILL